MSYDFTYDFAFTTSLGFAEGTVDVDYDVAGGELFITGFSNFKGKIYTTDGDVICESQCRRLAVGMSHKD